MRHFCNVTFLIMLIPLAGCVPRSVSNPSSASSATSSTPGGQSDPAAEDRAKLLGTWVAVDGEYQGMAMDRTGLRNVQWTFTLDSVSYPSVTGNVDGRYSLNPGSTPKSFDIKGSEPIQGIYELNGDTLKVCFAATQRPTSFRTGGTTQDTLLYVFKKEGMR